MWGAEPGAGPASSVTLCPRERGVATRAFAQQVAPFRRRPYPWLVPFTSRCRSCSSVST